MARQPFNTRWAQGVESEDNLNTFKAPDDLRLNSGWEGGQDKDAPPAGQENWWHNRADSAFQGLERNGLMAWHPQAVYGLGAPTYGPDGNYYESTMIDNTGNNPVSTVGFWRYCGSSFFSGHSPGDLKIVAHNNTPPTGWLKCNGSVLLRSSYQLLFSAIGTTHNTGGETSLQFRLPDYRGEFVRGFDDGRGVDAGRVFGSPQGQSLEIHDHNLPTTTGDTSAPAPAVPDAVWQSNTTPNPEVPGGLQAKTIGVSSGSNSGSETRPRNKVATYWIRY